MADIEFNLPEKKPMEMVEIEPGVYVAKEPLKSRENHDFFSTSLVYLSGADPAAVEIPPRENDAAARADHAVEKMNDGLNKARESGSLFKVW